MSDLNNEIDSLMVFTSDNVAIEIPMNLAVKIPLWNDMLCFCQKDAAELQAGVKQKSSIQLTTIEKETFEQIIKLLTCHELHHLIENMSIDDLAKVANAANFLQLDEIVDAICLHIVNMFDSLSTEEMKNHPLLRL